jgi:hypothetical protein
MEATDGAQLLRLCDGMPRTDGQAVAFSIERRDGKRLSLWCPVEDVTDIFSYLAALAKAATEQPGYQSRQTTTHTTAAQLPCLGLGLAFGKSPAVTNLVVRLPGFDLGFELDSTQLVALGDEFARMAKTFSAGGTRPQ